MYTLLQFVSLFREILYKNTMTENMVWKFLWKSTSFVYLNISVSNQVESEKTFVMNNIKSWS